MRKHPQGGCPPEPLRVPLPQGPAARTCESQLVGVCLSALSVCPLLLVPVPTASSPTVLTRLCGPCFLAGCLSSLEDRQVVPHQVRPVTAVRSRAACAPNVLIPVCRPRLGCAVNHSHDSHIGAQRRLHFYDVTGHSLSPRFPEGISHAHAPRRTYPRGRRGPRPPEVAETGAWIPPSPFRQEQRELEGRAANRQFFTVSEKIRGTETTPQLSQRTDTPPNENIGKRYLSMRSFHQNSNEVTAITVPPRCPSERGHSGV